MRINRKSNINQYEQLIDAEQRVTVASIEEAKALLNRKVHLVQIKWHEILTIKWKKM